MSVYRYKGRFFNDRPESATRMVTNHEEDLVSGIACYEGSYRFGRWEGGHRGLARDHDHALAWLNGDHDDPMPVPSVKP